MKKFLPFILIILVLPPLCIALDKAPIRLWDESRNALNAIEMFQSNNWLIPHFDGQPDMWNTKPPLLIWLQALMMKIIGIHPLAVRIPVMLAGLGTCLYLFYWIKNNLNNVWMAMIAPLILVTAYGYVDFHVIRTGDYDGLLTLFTTIYCLSYYQYIQSRDSKYLYLTGIFIVLAVLTKSVAGLLFLPALFLFTLFSKQVQSTLRSKHFYLAVLLATVPILSYYLIREQFNPGYIKAVFENELGGRYLNTLEHHHLPFNTYFKNILDYKFTFWIPLLIIGISLAFTKKHAWHTLAQYLLLLCLSYLLIISTSQTKLLWYDAPIYPFLAMIVAMAVTLILKSVNQLQQKPYLSIILTVALLLIPYWQIIRKVYHAKDGDHEIADYYMSNYIRQAILNNPASVPTKFLLKGYHPHAEFYLKMANAAGKIAERIEPREINEGDIIAVQDNHFKELLNQRYLMDSTHQAYITIYTIRQSKPSSE